MRKKQFTKKQLKTKLGKCITDKSIAKAVLPSIFDDLIDFWLIYITFKYMEKYLNVVKRGYKDCNLDRKYLKKALMPSWWNW